MDMHEQHLVCELMMQCAQKHFGGGGGWRDMGDKDCKLWRELDEMMMERELLHSWPTRPPN